MQRIFKFEKELIEGRIISRLNRFIMNVNINEREEKCYCPVTGKIFSINFNNSNIPCLLSSSSSSSSLSLESSLQQKKKKKNNSDSDSYNESDENNKINTQINTKQTKRKTNWTVEAISFDKVETRNKKWIGINQTKTNKYIEYFLSQNQISFLSINNSTETNPPSLEIQREVKLGNSRIDFLVGSHYLEVKTPLTNLCFKEPIPSHINLIESKKESSTKSKSQMNNTRLIKHFNELTNHQMKSKLSSKASICLVFMYDAKTFEPPSNPDEVIDKAVKSSIQQGVTYYQINLSIDPIGVQLIETKPLRFQ